MTPVHPRRILAGLTLAALVTGGLGTTAYAAPTGTVLGFGSDARGQLDVPGSLDGHTVVGVAAGDYFSVALTDDGQVTAWGDDVAGQSDVPASLEDEDVTTVAAGGNHALALTDTGHVVPWGDGSDGLDEVPSSLADEDVTAIAAGAFHSLAVADGHVVGWGLDEDHQADAPGALEGRTVTAVAAGRYHSLALTADGKVVGWGANWARQAEVPTSLDDQTVTAISARGSHSLALTADGTVVAWGSDDHHESDVPRELADKTVVAVAAGYFQSTALTSDGQVVTWGGDEGTAQHPVETEGTYVTMIAGGGFHTLAVSGDPAPARQLSVTGSISVTGTPRSGQTLTAESTVATTPHATLQGTWLRDGQATDVQDTTYALTDGDLGHTFSYRVTATKPGYDDAEVTSDELGPVGGGTLTLPTPTISGAPVVDGTLTASVPGATEGATLSYSWTKGDDVVGTDATYTPRPEDVGSTLLVTVTATKADYDTATSSATSEEVTAAGFTSGPEATITGNVKVGQTLTADEGTVSPAPDSYEYQWYAGGEAIDGATGRTFTLTGDELHTNVAVEVTALKKGYVEETDRSDDTAAVIDHGPGLTLTAGSTSLRRGQSTTLTWAAADARSLTTSANWSVTGLTGGTVTVTPTALGSTVYVLTGTDGTEESESTQVAITVRREAKKLPVTVSGGRHKPGSSLVVTSSRLDAGEAYTIKVGGSSWTGTASATGSVRKTVTVPRSLGTKTVTVTGSETDRVGSTTFRVVRR